MNADGLLDAEEVGEIIDNNVKAAQKALDKVTKNKPKPGTDIESRLRSSSGRMMWRLQRARWSLARLEILQLLFC